MNRRTSILVLAMAVLFTAFGVAPAQAVPPNVSNISSTRSIIYPLVNSAKYPGSTQFDVVGNWDDIDHLEIRNGSGTSIRDLTLDAFGSAKWSGLNSDGFAVAGTYTVVAVNATDEVGEATTQITVSTKQIRRLTYTKTVRASSTMIDKYVGRCSTLRKPSKRGWSGSLGYYANTKCKTQTFNASAASTVHVTRLPAAEKYIDLKVKVYGGAAKAKPGSRGVIRYLTLNGKWVNETAVGSKVGTHAGPQRNAAGMVDPGHYMAWGFVSAFKSQYDVKNFTVVVHYDVLR